MDKIEAADHLGEPDALERMGMDAGTLAALLRDNEEEIHSIAAAMT